MDPWGVLEKACIGTRRRGLGIPGFVSASATVVEIGGAASVVVPVDVERQPFHWLLVVKDSGGLVGAAGDLSVLISACEKRRRKGTGL